MDINDLWSGFDQNSNKQNSRCLAVNTILAGKYLVGPVLGQGGFGITYLGYDLNMETQIAIKEYFPVELVSRDTTTMHGDRVLSLSGEKSITYQQGLKKYVAEAQNVSQFSEVSGVVSVKDFFYENETAYIVMEYIDGISLKEYLKEKGGRLSEEETLAIMKPVLEALEKVHNAGIIHRDISPDNIMLTFEDGDPEKSEKAYEKIRSATTGMADSEVVGKRNGSTKEQKIKSVKLIDFGAARMTAKNDQKSLTIILKHGYAPEEQYRTHGEQGAWTDVYAVCAVMYRMLTGETPVPAMDRMFKDELKSFADFNIKVDSNTAAAILKGLAVKKDDRIQNMRDLIAALYEGEKIRVTGISSAKKKSTLLIGSISAVAAVILIAIIVFGLKGRLDQEKLIAGNLQAALDATESTSEEMSEIISSVSEKDALLNTENVNENEQETSGESEKSAEQVFVDLDTKEDDFGEVIVTATKQTSIDGCDSHILYIREDGTVASVGSNQYGEGNVGDWERIADVESGQTFSAGLREDGRVYVTGKLDGKEDVENWRDIIAIEADGYALYALKSDGTVLCTETNNRNSDYLDWTDIKAISVNTLTVIGLTNSGEVLATGMHYTPLKISGWQDVQFMANNQRFVWGVRSDGSVIYEKIWEEINAESEHQLKGIEECHNIVQIDANNSGYFAISEDGKFYSSRIEADAGSRHEGYYHVRDWEPLKGIAVFGSRIVGIQEDGTMQYSADNSGNAELSEFQNMKFVSIYSGMQLNSLIVTGITKDNNGMYFSLDRQLDWYELEKLEEASLLTEVSELIMHDVCEIKDGTKIQMYFCSVLDENGILHMMNDDHGDYVKVAENIKQVIPVVLNASNTYLAALTEDKKVKIIPTTSGDNFKPSDEIMAAEEWKDIERIATCRSRGNRGWGFMGLKSDGTVICAQHANNAMDVSSWNDIKSIYSGTYNMGAIKEDGTAIFIEEDSEYNYGQYNTEGWEDLKQLALGTFHTVGLKEDGTVYAVGRNDAGQCNVEDWTDIVFIAAGDSCTLGITSDGSLLIAGNTY